MAPREVRLSDVADVLEVVAEYACGTVVAHAAALRAVCKSYRRAVDTTVRRLVYATQPQLRTAPGAELRLHSSARSLDVVRIAFTCDQFSKIARLVSVVFALDGAKDQAHEAGFCGPRPVACSDLDHEAFPMCASWLQNRADAADFPLVPFSLGERQWQRALVPNLTDVCVASHDVSDAMCEAVGGPCRPWRSVSRLAIVGFGGQRLRLLRCLGHQLTQLSFSVQEHDEAHAMCAVVATLSKLVKLRVHIALDAHVVEDPALSTAIVDAIIAGGAALTHLFVNALLPADAVRALDAVPTITHCDVDRLRGHPLPAAVARRMVCCCSPGSETLPNIAHQRLRDLTFPQDMPSRGARKLTIVELTRPSAPLARGGFPLPPTLVAIHVYYPVGSENQSFVKSLGRNQPNLPLLAELVIPPVANITPLIAFAATLTTLSFTPWASEMSPYFPFVRAAKNDAALLKFEGALGHLRNLRSLDAPFLPTPRCFLAGRHTELRDLHVKAIGEECDGGAAFAALRGACPRLMRVLGKPWGWPYPAGWAECGAALVRDSLRDTPVPFHVEQFPPERDRHIQSFPTAVAAA